MTQHYVTPRQPLRRIASLSLLLLAACTASRTQAAAGDSASAGDSVGEAAAFGLERGVCHGSCPIYAVRLFDDGRVHFTGTRFVRVAGNDSARIAPAAVAALRTAFATRAFDLVPAIIEYGSPSCGQYVADLSTVVLTARTARGSHTVRFDEGCTAHPPMLDTLSRMIDSIGGTARWTTPAKP
jgi:Domain of unknown function (DUF6438)